MPQMGKERRANRPCRTGDRAEWPPNSLELSLATLTEGPDLAAASLRLTQTLHHANIDIEAASHLEKTGK